ncbi:MAG: DNA methyltransferase [Bacteroidales bacterium]
MSITINEAKEKIKELVDKFDFNIQQYKNKNYDEANTRVDFIDPFFEALGWDVSNKAGYAEQYREVVREDKIKIQGKTKAPDYCFRIGGNRKFFVEAKKPQVDIKSDYNPAYQLRRYAYTANLPLSILTDFEEFAIYDTRIKPNVNDKADNARIFYCTYREYLKNFDFIYNTFSKEGILKGSFDRYIESNKNKKGTSEVDKEFLKLIDDWREKIAKNIAKKNYNLDIDEINFAVQKIIDRIIFLRIAEDRGIEKYGQLQDLLNKPYIYSELLKLFYDSENKYDSGLFDFNKEDKITQNILIDDDILKYIIKSIYYPDSPYEFSVLDVEILGNIYEQFLGKTIRLTPSRQVKIEYKPDVKKAGGVYYTPSYIVDYIVSNTVGELIKDKTPEDVNNLKMLDPACGSGSFLLGAYEFLLNYHLNYYLKNKDFAIKANKIYEKGHNDYSLTFDEKKKILLNNIYGVDIDSGAVEVTKLSLILKLLEGETQELIKNLKNHILPDLSNNIKCGNSLIDTSVLSSQTLSIFDPDNLKHLNPMNWEDAFPEIIKNGGFDVIIGNPPYVKEYTDREPFEYMKLCKAKEYYQGKMDLWYAFACKSIDLLKAGGYHSFIATNNWITSQGASILRNKILDETVIIKFIDFADFKVFQNASIQTMIYVVKKEKPNKKCKVKYTKILNKNILLTDLVDRLNKDISKEKYINTEDYEWFYAIINPNELKNNTFTFVSDKIQAILDKIKIKSNYKLIENVASTGIDVHQDFVIDSHLKLLKDKEIKKGDGIFILSEAEKNSLNLTNDELEIIKPYYTTKELKRYYGSNKNKYWIIYSDINVRKNINKYPNIKRHLDKYKPIITSDFKPYGLHRARDQRFFEGEKIISLRKTRIPNFTYTDFSCYVSQTFFVIKPEDIDMKYLTGLLNSKVIYFWLFFKGKKQGDQLQIDKEPLLQIPLIKPEVENIIKYIAKLVDDIIQISQTLENCQLPNQINFYQNLIKSRENEIDQKIYELYNLSDDDKMEIEKVWGNNVVCEK